MDDTDLSGLDLQSAREYVLAWATDGKRLAKDLEAAREELGTWTRRVALAAGKGAADLAEAARAKAAELAARVEGLAAEKADIDAKVARMRERLPMIRASERSVDADLLLAELQLMTGTLLGPEGGGEGAAATEAKFAALEKGAALDSALEELKRKAAGG